MAIADEVLIQPVETVAPSRPRIWLRLAIGFVLGLVLVGGAAAAGLYAWDQSYEARVLPGVTAAGVSLAGMDRAQATAALDQAYASVTSGRLVIETEAGEISVPYSQFERRVNTADMADAALRAGREGTTAERVLGEIRLALNGRTIEPTLLMNDAALAAAVKDQLGRLELAPVDAQIVKGADETYTTIAAQAGRRFDAAAAAVAAAGIVHSLDAPAEVRVPAPAVMIPPARGDDVVEAVKGTAEDMVGRLVVTFRDKKWNIRASTVRSWIGFGNGADGSVQTTVDEARIVKALKKVAKGVRRDPLSAVYLKAAGGRVVGVAAGKDGIRLDTARTAAAVSAALKARGLGAGSEPVGVKIEKVEPKLTTEEALKKGPLMVPLGTWKTWFPVSERNFFGANIWLPAKIIDGTVLYPGQRFEWWSALGPVTSSRGFGPGGFIAGNHTEPTGALGGGMCSSSTTLFNAALRAGLRMGARSNHKYYIYRYPLGLDATVSKLAGGGGQTMSFTNDMKHPIVIRAFRYTAGGLGWVRYEIWGIPDGRRVSISKPSVANVVKATTRTEYVSTLPPGAKEQTEFPANQMDVSVTRVVRNRNGGIIHRDTWRTHYVLWNGIIQIGR